MVINMYIVDRIEDNFVILEYDGKIIEVEKCKLPDVKENDILYLQNGCYVIDIEKTENSKENIRSRFNRLKG